MAGTTGIVANVQKTLTSLADIVMPPACLACGAPVTHSLSLCADCWGALPATPDHVCVQCGTELATEWQAESHCLQCLQKPPPFRQFRAPYRYDGPARRLVLGVKNGHEAWAPMMARAMARVAPEWVAPGRVLVPVPLHRWRLARRGYNQALLLAAALQRLGGATLARDWLRRQRHTRSTQGMTRAQRQRNVAGAFAVAPRHQPALAGADITLVDDVMTTGATASACARALLQAGARTVDILVYARVAGSTEAPYLSLDPDWENDGQN